MQRPEESTIHFTDLSQIHPDLEYWFAKPDHQTAIVKGDRRFMSANEKVTHVGGIEQIKDNLSHIPKRLKDTYLGLLACRTDPIVIDEMIYFWMILQRETNKKMLENLLTQLMDQSMVYQVFNLTYLRRFRSDLNLFTLYENQLGFITNNKGMTKMSDWLDGKGFRALLGRLAANL